MAKPEKIWIGLSDNEYCRRIAFESEERALRSAIKRSTMSCGTKCFIDKHYYDKAVEALKGISTGRLTNPETRAEYTLKELGEL